MIDINCDMGEIEELLSNNTYSNLMDHIDSINIACGGHAGDKEMMHKVVKIAKNKNVKIGAHPSYPDRENFGRVELNIDSEELSYSIATQIKLLINIAENEGTSVVHVKPHGALYNKAAQDKKLAKLICDTVGTIDPKLPIMCLANSQMLSVIEKSEMKAISEAFADRTYENNGSLRKRGLAKAVITDEIIASKQAASLYFYNKVIAYDGSEVPIISETICIHSDTANALNIARAVKYALNNHQQ